MAANANGHQIWIGLSGHFPDTIELLRATFDSLVPQDQIVVWTTPARGPKTFAEHARPATDELVREAFLAALMPDVLHVSSLFEGLGDAAITSINSSGIGPPTAVTLYDLIPLVHRQIYLAEPATESWYERKLGHLRRAQLFLAISESSRREGIDRLDLPEEWVVNVSTAADAIFKPVVVAADERLALQRRYGLSRPFLMYTGGIDHRKNIEGLISAYAALPASLRTKHHLAIVCMATVDQKETLKRWAHRCGLAPDEVILTGFVPDEDLVRLYSLCRAFVFPSWHEGFGLPALEAMSCGAAVVGSNSSSVPEVIGRTDALFDPHDTSDMAAMLFKVLADDRFRQDLRHHALEQSRKFSWDNTARTAIDALERLHARHGEASVTRVSTPRTRRPRLAYISPLPPERSGIADYSAELLPGLARYYDIDVIVDQAAVDDPWINANVSIRNIRWFDENATLYDRVLYHFGNSALHQHMFALLERHPGTVVLHDFFLSGVLAHMEWTSYRPRALDTALYVSHGYPALRERALASPPADVVWKYPANLPVLQDADGVIVHSDFARSLADRWYGRGLSSNWIRIPLLRRPRDLSARADARKQLGMADEDFLVCCFGMMGPTKLNLRMITAWYESPLARDPRCHLVFVGEEDQGDYGTACRRALTTGDDANRIRITGFAPASTYRTYLLAADVAVQLRGMSRGETSASTLECMAFALPTVVNAVGAATELPPDCVVHLKEPFSDAELAATLTNLRQDPEWRRAIGERARANVVRYHHPRDAADRYFEAIEQLHGTGSQARIATLADEIVQADACAPKTEEDWMVLSACIAQNELSCSPGPSQWLVDVSELVRRDGKSGIQRVVRFTLAAWLRNAPAGFRVEPIYCDDGGIFRYARRFTLDFLQVETISLNDDPVETGVGDVYFGLDLFLQLIPERRANYDHLRQRGVRLYFVVYDLLPVSRASLFPDGIGDALGAWLGMVCQSADGLACISRTVADEVAVWLATSDTQRLRPLRIGWFHLGGDIESQGLERSSDALQEDAFNRLREQTSVLMVGTLEPRKRHAQALTAFETLWQRGSNAILVIVGKQGWKTELIARKLREHTEWRKRLFWFDNVTDGDLQRIYENVSGVLVASEGEGFGLPLVEAARRKRPLLVRDIPVFREIAGESASYFAGDSAEALASALQGWLSAMERGTAPDSAGLHHHTWDESVGQLTDMVLDGRWYSQWPQPPATS